MKLDATDIKILEILQQDGRITTKALADQLNLTTTPCFRKGQTPRKRWSD